MSNEEFISKKLKVDQQEDAKTGYIYVKLLSFFVL